MNLGQQLRNHLREYLLSYETIEEALAELDAEDARWANFEKDLEKIRNDRRKEAS